MMISPDTAIHLIEQYGYIFLFAIAVIEGPIITIIAAFLASEGYLNVFAVFAVVTAGDLIGEVLLFGLGRFGRTGALASARRYLGMTGERIAQFERYVQKHGVKILFLAKYTQTGLLALPAAGAARMPIGTFLWYNTLATVPKSLVLVLVGYYFGYAYNRIDGYLAKASLIGFGILCIAGVYILLRRYLRTLYGER